MNAKEKRKYQDPKELVDLIRLETRADVWSIIQQVAHGFMEDGGGGLEGMYGYFSAVYGEIYHSLIFKQLVLRNETRELLEVLASPIFKKPEKERKEIMRRYVP